MRKVETASESLSADEDVDFARFDFIIEGSERTVFFVVSVKTGYFGVRKEAGKFGFEKFGAEAFMENTGVVTFGAAFGDFFFVTANMTTESIRVGMEGHGQETVRAEGLPTAVFANSNRGGAAAIMKNESLMLILNIVLYICQ